MAAWPDKAGVTKAILDDIADGLSLTAACRKKGRPAHPTFMDWVNADPELGRAYDRARDVGTDAMFEEIVGIADESGDPNRLRVRVDTRKWVIARRNPKKYGDRQAIDLNHGLQGTDDAALVAELRQLAARLGATLPATLLGRTEETA